jgi:uncharacterized membrane protein YphA (DoxX/SURF4 family)
VGVVATVAAVLLGLAFLVAGASKVAAGPSWPEQARGLGAPAVVIPFVPWVEMVLGALLVTQVARRAAALAACVLLVAFTGLIIVRLAQGRHPPCACFGAWSSRPIGPGHLIRNAALTVLSVIALLG